MKVLQVNKLYHPDVGGVETVVRDIAEGLDNRVDMTVLVCKRSGRASRESINGIDVLRASSLGTVLSMPLSPDFLLKYRKLSKNADILQLHAPFPLADLAVLLFRRKGKLIVWWHSDIVRQRFLRRLLSPVIRNTLNRASVILVADEAIINASDFLHKYKHKCKIIPFGLDFTAYPTPPDNFLQPTDANKVKLLFVGRLVYYKGIDVLIKAMKTVKNAELFIVGTGDLETSLREASKQAHTDTKIHFMGYLSREALLAAYRGCDAFIFPSVANSEAFGICQLEAMYYAKPVINTNLPTAVPTVSIHGETGLTVPPGDADALAKAINTLAENPALRQAYGEAAAKRVREKYNKAEMLEAVYKCYEDCI